MAKEVKIPDIGDAEGVEVIDVLVAEGDTIAKEDSLITLESDKAAMDVPSPTAGKVVALKVKNGDKVSEGDVILTVEESDASDDDDKQGSKEESASKGDGDGKSGEKEDKSENRDDDKQDEQQDRKSDKDESAQDSDEDENPQKPQSDAAKQSEPKPARTPPTVDRISQVSAHAGPSVRKFARELGVDLSKVKGSGHKARITHNDVKLYVKSALRGGVAAGGGLPAVPEVDYSRFGEVSTRPLSRLKRIAGPRLQAAWVNAPRVTQNDEADMTTLDAVRKAMNAGAEQDDAKISPLAFLVRAVGLALKAYPDFNSALDAAGENLIERQYFNIGFAVDTDQGLMVPVLRDADQKSTREIAAELAELAAKAREGKLKRDDIEGACFTISSLGGIGGTSFTPIVNAPEVAILGVSKTEMKPKWNGHDFEPRLMLPLSLSYDHRVIDGAQAIHFTRHLAETIETLRGLVG